MLQIHDLAKRYGENTVFSQVSLALRAGEFVALVGESGVGKSTLLNCIAGLDRADAGRIMLAGTDLATLDDDGCALLRRERVGFVFQAFHVLPHLPVAENVALPLWLAGHGRGAGIERAEAALAAVGLHGFGARWPAELSGGQLQRVAIARAVVHGPQLILADEPTGNLDPGTAGVVLEVLRRQVREAGATCLLVTHSAAAAALADRTLRLTPAGIVAGGA
ncbi:MAG: ABC transporter ATP-binding protein [Burkholderiales bacterium]|nr:ABC transporter ATP-binding protein [Burkholderiales bacterium]